LRGQVAVEGASPPASHRGQVAVEFMLYTGVFIFIAVVAFVAVTDLQNSEVPLQQNGLVKETGDSFVNVFTLAVKGGEGFSYNYTFPKTIYSLPYQINFKNLDQTNATMLIEWNGSYGAFSYQYQLPPYNYFVSGSCLSGEVLSSTNCKNVLMLNNDGENLTITQLS
jgi:hypothetical protein